MNTNNTFSVTFFIKNDKADKDGEVPIFMRITINGERAHLSIQRKIDPKRWNNSGRAKGNKDDIKELNNYLDILKNKVYTIRTDLIERNEIITADKVKNEYLGNGKRQKTVVEVFKFHNEKVKELVGKDYSSGTLDRYEVAFKHICEFIKYKYKTDDLFYLN